jgi:hypothetical protein
MKIFIIGTVALSTALGAGAAYASNPNARSSSPYALEPYGSSGQVYVNPGYGDNPGYPPYLEGAGAGEGRAAFVEHTDRDRNTSGGHNADRNSQSTGYDNTRENPAYPSGFGDDTSNY